MIYFIGECLVVFRFEFLAPGDGLAEALAEKTVIDRNRSSSAAAYCGAFPREGRREA